MKTALFLTAIGDKYRSMVPAAAARWLSLLPEISSITIATEEHAALMGLPEMSPIHTACLLKLHAFNLIPQDCDSVLYADLDILPIQPWSPSSALANADFACVRDRWDDPEVARVASTIGIPSHSYFNAGLFHARRSTELMFSAARTAFDMPKWIDQTSLNLARKVHSPRTAWLPWHANAMDHHDCGLVITASHAPHHAWTAWKESRFPPIPCFPSTSSIIASLDYSHPYTTHPDHLIELAALAAGRRHCLDLGTFRGHSAIAIASAGALVTTIDPENTTGRVFHPSGLSYDAFASTSQDWISTDPNTRYDLIFHDARHGNETIPELERYWNFLHPAGALAIHDAEQLTSWTGQTLTPPPVASTRTTDPRGRQLLTLHHP